jgi:hypothetical protein
MSPWHFGAGASAASHWQSKSGTDTPGACPVRVNKCRTRRYVTVTVLGG